MATTCYRQVKTLLFTEITKTAYRLLSIRILRTHSMKFSLLQLCFNNNFKVRITSSMSYYKNMNGHMMQFWTKSIYSRSNECSNDVYTRLHRLKWGLVCQRKVSRTLISNYIPQYLWGVITCSCPRYVFWHTGSRSIALSSFDHAHTSITVWSALR